MSFFHKTGEGEVEIKSTSLNMVMIVLLKSPLLQHGNYLLFRLYRYKIPVLKIIQGLAFNLLTFCISSGRNRGKIIVWTSEIQIYLHD